ncbi:uncharacterized protein DS421_2g40080 [Arachis hypogaea]|nr:uncharacterized protein DS421_2g40080 [Arachis hypogaea]
MARADGSDWDINRLNETSHNAGTADFAALPSIALASESYPSSTRRHRPVSEEGWIQRHGASQRFHIRQLLDYGIRGAIASGDPHVPSPVGWYHMETWELVEQLLGVRPPVVPQQAAQKESFSLKLVWLLSVDGQVEQLGPSALAATASGFWAVPDVVLGFVCAGLDVLVTVLGSTARCHGHRWLHSAVDVLDIPKIFSVVSTRARDSHVSYGCEQQSRYQHEARVLRWRVTIQLRFNEFVWTPYDDPALQALCPLGSSKRKSGGHGC